MPNLIRKFQKVFAQSATNNGQFGSLQLGTKITDTDPEVLQQLTAYEQGWDSAVLSGEQLPSLEEFQGLQYKTDYQLSYLLNKGIPEYDAQSEYFIGDIQREIGGTRIYRSITENNIGNPLTDIANWSLLLDLANKPINPNVIINPDFKISQRGTSFISVSDQDYTLDRWLYNKTGTMVHDVSQSVDTPTVVQSGSYINNSVLINCTTAQGSIGINDFCSYSQIVEGYRFQIIAQKQFTLSFWVKGTKTGTYCVSFRNSGSDRSYVAEYTINTTDIWEFKTITVTASPSSGSWDYIDGIGLKVDFTQAVGSAFQTTAGSWQTGNFLGTSNQVNACDSTSNNFRIARVKIEPGPVSTEFVPRPIGQEISMCKRFYRKSYELNTNPGTITDIGREAGTAANTQDFHNLGSKKYDVDMRGIPTTTFYNPITGAPGTIRNIGAGTDIVPTLFNASSNGYEIRAAGLLVAADSYSWHYTADAEL